MIIKQVGELDKRDLSKIEQVFINNVFVKPIFCELNNKQLLVDYYDITMQKINTKYLASNDIVHIKR